MNVRRYHTGEEQAMWTVYFRATHESNGRDYHRDLLNRWAPPDQDMAQWEIRVREKKPFVAVLDGKVVGLAEINSTGEIGYFYVLPEFQRQGVGSKLLETLEMKAVEGSVEKLVADVSVTAREFFEAKGFQVIEARSNIIIGHPAPNFRMNKRLKAHEATEDTRVSQ